MAKTSLLALTCAFGFVVAAACGPSKPAETADDGAGASAPTATTTTDAAGGAGATTDASGGGTATGGTPDAGGSTATGGAGTGGAGGTGGTTGTGGAGAGGVPPGPAPKPMALVAAGDAANGGKLYEKEGCVGCHGTKAKGPNAKFPNLFKMKWTDEAQVDKAFTAIKKGKSPMPPYEGKLDDKQIADLVAFVKTAK